ncbi:GntR family transcriptional regulator [Conexibacter woesei]|uniref:Transcriptional regulator, GntR family n=1 Tax=Conexibacter woesei (strain DSM 14684 / CCUG 47730 / CIP 108061 / JCM 11494 / NBRC 100937 / ID131577) TaxID=469383 RepID=D3FF38_CONWI|nr:GntR family transcriptional regulator [Conexibacter woesei]ADB51755.1 transcriptional regulator, GntR family [Conexibacter woesei DSM 14684]
MRPSEQAAAAGAPAAGPPAAGAPTAAGPIARTPLREEVRRRLLAQLFDGTLPVGERINERRVAETLGVSRTPVREALMALEQEGFVASRPARGFAPTPLSARDVREVYPMVAALEALAVRSTEPAVLAARLDALAALADELAAAGDDARRVQRLDDRWHERLVSGCDNDRLLRTLDGLKRVVRRYELAWLGERERVELSTAQHHAIVAALRTGDLDDATALIELNWRGTMAGLLAWLERREEARNS